MATHFKNATLVQLDPPSVQSGNLRQEDGRIVAVGKEATAFRGDEIVDCDGAVLMPGLVNGHTHLYSSLAVGMPAPPTAPANFHEILQFVWWRLDRAHTLESTCTSGMIGALAAVRCGTTTLVDHHASPDAIAGSLSALEEGIATVGCRAVLCYETTCRNRSAEAREGLDENRRYIIACQNKHDEHFAGMVGAHASFTLDDAALSGCVDLARELGIGVHIHAAEDPVDEKITREKHGCKLLDRFEKHGLLNLPGTIIAHGTHFSDEDVMRINERSEKGVRSLFPERPEGYFAEKTPDPFFTMAHNPTSNMNNGVGYSRPVRLTKPPMLGTDGIGANMFGEARTALFKSHDAGAPLPFTRPLEMLGQSARHASACLGIKLGVLEAGAAADLVLTNYRPATPLTADNLAGHLTYAMGPEQVRDVMIDGHWVLRQDHVVTCNKMAIRDAAVEVARQLHERMQAL